MALEDFLGRGWGFPPAFDTQGVEMTTGVEDIEKSLEILLSTRLRERIMLPEYGCNLDVFLFEPLNTSLRTQIKETVKDAIYYHEPRIDPLNVTLEQPPESLGSLLIVIEYRIRATNTRYNYVFPFYKEEASQLDIDPTLPHIVSTSFNN
ncbi:GPW/gp25 family protein [Runella sp. MFBS21]|uniref:GPW/gp25 family protein n=1 Tax=Runella sp. MFBS21 TaxID=3034018 RepID=UPI0023F6577B|nr:GPW/gp25 family protein [Runella sp. MFBS21]MDF7816973.1 GPW/gp25 family protein [Runella sp. MFBS21]